MHLHVSGSEWLSPSAYQLGDERRECPSRYTPASMCVGVGVLCVCVCPHSRASIRATCSISTSPCTVVPPQMLIAALESHHRDLTACWCLTQTPPCSASNLHIQPLWEARWYTLLRIWVWLIGTHLFFSFFFFYPSYIFDIAVAVGERSSRESPETRQA